MSPRIAPLLVAAAVLAAGAFLLARGCGDEGTTSPLGAAPPGTVPAGEGPGATDLADVAPSEESRAEAPSARDPEPRPAAAEEVEQHEEARPRTEPFVGRVVDHLGNPIAGARVWLDEWNERRRIGNPLTMRAMPADEEPDAVTGPHGRFEHAAGRKWGRTIEIVVRARGYLIEEREHTFEEAHHSDLGDVFLQPAIVVEGWVRDENGRAIEGAEVRRIEEAKRADASEAVLEGLGFTGDDSVTTDADGRFELPHEPPGSIVLVATEESHLPARYDGVTPPAPGILSPVEIEMVRGGTIEGRILGFPEDRRGARVVARALDGQQVEDPFEKSGLAEMIGATFSGGADHDADVESDGSFALRGLVARGRYEIQAIERHNFVEVVELSEPLEVVPGQAGVVLHYEGGASVSLRLRDSVTGKPIRDAALTPTWPEKPARNWLTPNGRQRPRKHEGGRITLYELRPPNDPSPLDLRIVAPGYYEEVVEGVTVGTRDEVDLGVVLLEPAPKLHFRVVDAATGEPIHNARVRLREEDESARTLEEVLEDESGRDVDMAVFGLQLRRSTGRTDREGRCTLDSFDAETAELTVRVLRYPRYRVSGFPLEKAREEHLVRLSRGSELAVTVVDPASAPIEDAVVRLRAAGADANDARRATTDVDGLAVFDAVAAGAYEVRADHAIDRVRIQMQTAGIDEDEEDDEAWTAIEMDGAKDEELTLELPGLGVLEGVVLSGGGPLEGATVSLQRKDVGDQMEMMLRIQEQFGNVGTRTDDRTDVDGGFRIEMVPEGEYVLRVRHADLAMPAREEVEVLVGHNEVTVRVSNTAVLGLVTDSEGSPIPGARIRASAVGDGSLGEEIDSVRRLLGAEGVSTTTGADGRYELRGLRPDTPLRLAADADGFVPARSDEIRLAATEARSGVDFRLEPAGSIRVTLVGELPDVPVTVVRARHLGEDGDPVDAPASGRSLTEFVQGRSTVLRGLEPGRWEVSASGFDRLGGDASKPVVEVVAGEEAVVELVLGDG